MSEAPIQPKPLIVYPEASQCPTFLQWANALEFDPGFWCIRRLPYNLFWRNRSVQKLRGNVPADTDYKTALNWISVKDQALVAAKTEEAIRTGEVVYVVTRINSPEAKTCTAALLYVECKNKECPPGCGLIVMKFVLDETDASKPSPDPD
jgi:hypothetical protein